MAVMVPREKWTDERLDDLNKKVDDGFARVEGEIKQVRQELNHQVTGLRAEMNARFENLEARLDARFGALNRNMFAGFFVIVAAIVGSNAF